MSNSVWATTINTSYWQGRQGSIALQVDVNGGGRLTTFGDSITESQPWTEVGNVPYQEAGTSFAGVIDMANAISPILPQIKPTAAIIMIGINDTIWSTATDVGTYSEWFNNIYGKWVAAYDEFLETLLQYTQRVALCTVMPVDPASQYAALRLPRIQELNIGIRGIANYFHLHLIDTYGAVALSSGYAPPGFTLVDGVHASANCFARIKPLYDQARAAMTPEPSPPEPLPPAPGRL